MIDLVTDGRQLICRPYTRVNLRTIGVDLGLAPSLFRDWSTRSPYWHLPRYWWERHHDRLLVRGLELATVDAVLAIKLTGVR